MQLLAAGQAATKSERLAMGGFVNQIGALSGALLSFVLVEAGLFAKH